MKLSEYKKKAFKNPEFRKEYERTKLRLELEMLWTKIKMKVGKFLKR